MNARLSAHSVSVGYGDTVISRDVTLDIPDGEFVFLIGASGSGKSTFLQLLIREENVSSGDIFFNDFHVNALNGKQVNKLRQSIGYVIQSGGLFPHWSVSKNIGAIPRILNWDKKRIAERTEYLLDLVGLDAATFADARVPVENLLGEEGRGYANFLSILDEGRIAIAALATGVAQGCVDESVKYAKERQSFGKAIGEYQSVSFAIARMEARAHVARTAYYDAAAKMLAGKPFKKEASIAKMIASEAAMDNARDATQIFGGYGYVDEYPVAKYMRDARVMTLYEGTSQVQKLLIGRAETGINAFV